MSQIQVTVSNFSLVSTWEVSAHIDGSYYISSSPTTASAVKAFSFASIPAGSTINWATLTATLGSPATGAAIRTVNGTVFSGTMAVSINAGASTSFDFRFKANGIANSPTGARSSSQSYASVTITVDYTAPPGGSDPTLPVITGVYVNGNTFNQYFAAGSGATLTWTAVNGTANPIASYVVLESDNGGAWSTFYAGNPGATLALTVYAPAEGVYRLWAVKAVGTTADSAYVYTALAQVYTNPSVPAGLTRSPSNPQPGDTVTLTWSASTPGAGMDISQYQILEGGSHKAYSGATSYQFSAGAPGTYSYTVKAIGSVSGYASAASSAVSVVSAYKASTGSLNKTTVPMDGSSKILLTVSPSKSTYTHKAVWSIGTKSWTDTMGAGDTSSELTVPANWCEERPNNTSGTANVTLETYSSGTKVAETSYNFTVTVPASVVPTLTSITDALVSNGVTEDITKYVQSHSKVALTINGAAGVYNSTIASVAITGGGFSATASPSTLGPLPTVGNITFTGKITDSRGRTAQKTVTIAVQAYTKPSLLNVSMFRCDDEGTADGAGGYVRFYAKSVFSSIDSENEATLEGRVYMKGAEPSAYTEMTSETAWIGGGGTLLSTKSYVADIRITDLLYDYTFEVQIPTETVGLHILDGVAGAAIGKYCELPGYFESAFPLSAPSLYGHQNIIHNWDFRLNPVNQRASSGAVSSGYFYDRWMRYAGTITINSTYLSMPADASIEQRIEGLGLSGKAVTVSILLGDAVISGQGTFPTSAGTESVTLTGFGTATLGYHADYMFVRITATDSTRNLQGVKLEMGAVSTLAYDPPMDYTTDFLKCARFYYVTAGIFTGAQHSTTVRLLIPIVVPMRILPTYGGDSTFNIYVGDGTLYSVSSVSIESMSGGILTLVCTSDTSLLRKTAAIAINARTVIANADL